MKEPKENPAPDADSKKILDSPAAKIFLDSPDAKRPRLENFLHPEPILAKNFLRPELQLEDFYVLIVKEKNELSAILKIVSKNFPMDLKHLKRIRKSDDGKNFLVLLRKKSAGDFSAGEIPTGGFPGGDFPAGNFSGGEIPAGGFPAGDFPPEFRRFEVKILPIPVESPETRSQFEFARPFWPVTFREDKRLEALLARSVFIRQARLYWSGRSLLDKLDFIGQVSLYWIS